MKTFKVCDNEGTLIDTVQAYDEESAVWKVSQEQGIEKQYLTAREA